MEKHGPALLGQAYLHYWPLQSYYCPGWRERSVGHTISSGQLDRLGTDTNDVGCSNSQLDKAGRPQGPPATPHALPRTNLALLVGAWAPPPPRLKPPYAAWVPYMCMGCSPLMVALGSGQSGIYHAWDYVPSGPAPHSRLAPPSPLAI